MPAPKAIGLLEHVLQSDLGMVITLVFDGFLAILDGFLRAPLDTGQTLFASVKP
jgi:hypothetical protein